MQNILRNALVTGLCLTTTIPLIWTGQLYFPAITGKAIVFYGLVQLLTILYLIHLVIDRRPFLPTISSLGITLTLYVGLIGLTTLLSDQLLVSFFGNLERMDGFVTTLHLGILFWLMSAVLSSAKEWRWFFTSSLVVSMIIFFSALSQFITHVDTGGAETRVDVLLGNATYLGAYAMLSFWIALYMATESRWRSWTQYTLMLIAGLNIATIIFSGTRSAILGLLAGAGVATAWYLFRSSHISNQYKLLFVAGGILFGAIVIGGVLLNKEKFIDTPVVGRLLLITPETITEQPRYFIWNAAWQGIKEKPLLGHGPEQFASLYSEYYNPETKDRFHVAIGESWNDRTHNFVLEHLVIGGVSLLFVFITLLFITIRSILTSNRVSYLTQSILFGALTAYLVNNLFGFDSLGSLVLWFALLGFTHFLSDPKEIKIDTSIFTKPASKLVLGALVVMILVLAHITTIRALNTADVLAAFLIETDDIEEFEAQGIALYTMKQYTPWQVNVAIADHIYVTQRNQKFRLPESIATLHASQTEALRARTLLNSQALYSNCKLFGQLQETNYAIELCEAALEGAPRTQDIAIELAALYRSQNEHEAATAILSESFILEPEYDKVRFAYAISLLYTNQVHEANELLNYRYGTTTIDDRELLLGYIDAEEYDTALNIIDKHIAADPYDASYHISRLGIYLKLEETEKAITAVEELMQVSEAFAQSGEELIRRIKRGEDVLGSDVSF